MKKRIAVVGVGYIGKIHLKLLRDNPNWEVAGIYDIDRELNARLAKEYGVRAFGSLQEAIEASDAIDIATPSGTHFGIAREAVRQGRHIFVEKPVTTSMPDARDLERLVSKSGVVCQVGHVERFNPAFTAARPFLGEPAFIEVHRLAQYNPRGTDVSVILDLMMHDLDLILSIVNQGIKTVHVAGTPIISRTADIANARIEFEGGCVANITTNRVSLRNSRKFRVFTRKNLVNIDLLEKRTEVIRIANAVGNEGGLVLDPGNGAPKKAIVFENPPVLSTNAINEELNTFHQSIASGSASTVGMGDAIRTLEVAFAIEEQLKPAGA